MNDKVGAHKGSDNRQRCHSCLELISKGSCDNTKTVELLFGVCKGPWAPICTLAFGKPTHVFVSVVLASSAKQIYLYQWLYQSHTLHQTSTLPAPCCVQMGDWPCQCLDLTTRSDKLCPAHRQPARAIIISDWQATSVYSACQPALARWWYNYESSYRYLSYE